MHVSCLFYASLAAVGSCGVVKHVAVTYALETAVYAVLQLKT